MKRCLVAIALTAAGAVAASSNAGASSAASHVAVRSFVLQLQYDYDGIGSQQGWYHHWSEYNKVEFAPKLAWYNSFASVTVPAPGGAVESDRSIQYLVAGRTYTEKNGSKWVVQKLSAGQIKSDAAMASPYWEIGTLYAIPGIALAGPRHYHVTCTVAQIKNFWVNYLGFGYSLLAGGHDIETVTLDFWFDQSGRPASLIITGHAPDVRMSYRLTYSRYNAPVVIHAPA